MHRAEQIPFLNLSLDSASESSHHCILEYLYFYISNIIWIRIILVHLMDDPIPLIREAMTQGTHVSLCDAGAKKLRTYILHKYIVTYITGVHGRNFLCMDVTFFLQHAIRSLRFRSSSRSSSRSSASSPMMLGLPHAYAKPRHRNTKDLIIIFIN